MGLFSTLLENNAVETTAESSAVSSSFNNNSSNKSLNLPTVVQIFTAEDDPFPLSIDTAAADPAKKPKNRPPSYAALHYTAVQCSYYATTKQQQQQQDDTEAASGLRLSNSKKKDRNATLTPDLGVWNCRIDTKQLGDVLLPIAAAASKTFCMVVDLSKQASVEPSVTKMQQAIVRYLIEHGSSGGGTGDAASDGTIPKLTTTQTTTLYQLRTIQFGLGDKDEKSASKLTSAAPDESDRKVKIALQICVKTTAPSSDDGNNNKDYRTQQLDKLLVYHLHKYAAALNASLVFVNGDTSSSKAVLLSETKEEEKGGQEQQKQQQPTITVQQLPLVWKALAQDKAVWSEPLEGINDTTTTENDDALSSTPEGEPNSDEGGGENNNNSSNDSGYALIYGPGNHNTELIESVLLRSASYPGHWDAATDSVWNVIKATDTNKKSNDSSSKSTAAGDGGWLEELRASIVTTTAPGMQTPPPKSANKKDAQSATKTPNDAAVSSFFEGLLK